MKSIDHKKTPSEIARSSRSRGYRYEYEAKKILISTYGEKSVVKIAVSGASDFLVVPPGSGSVEKMVEVKYTSKPGTWYPSKRERKQIREGVLWCVERNIPYELWIRRPRKGWEILGLVELSDMISRWSDSD